MESTETPRIVMTPAIQLSTEGAGKVLKMLLEDAERKHGSKQGVPSLHGALRNFPIPVYFVLSMSPDEPMTLFLCHEARMKDEAWACLARKDGTLQAYFDKNLDALSVEYHKPEKLN